MRKTSSINCSPKRWLTRKRCKAGQIVASLRGSMAKFSHILSPGQEAWWMLEACLGLDRVQLICLGANLAFTLPQAEQLAEWLRQRCYEHKPLAYLLGWAPFFEFKLMVQPPLLIPRPETENWLEALLKMLIPHKAQLKGFKVADLGTGTGCIALALAEAVPQIKVIGVDIDPLAIQVAELNRQTLGLGNVKFLQGDWTAALGEQKFDLIVSNPPYLASEELLEIEPSVRNWEGELALVGGQDGLMFYRRLAKDLPKILTGRVAPCLMVEIGEAQVESVQAIFKAHGWPEAKVWTDQFGRPRAMWWKSY